MHCYDDTFYVVLSHVFMFDVSVNLELLIMYVTHHQSKAQRQITMTNYLVQVKLTKESLKL